MELRGIEVAAMQRRAEGHDVARGGNRVAAHGGIVAVHIVHMASLELGGDERARPSQLDSVPPHVGNLQLGAGAVVEALHVEVEYSQPLRVALLARAAQQLQAYAYAQHRLREALYHRVEPLGAQVVHGRSRLAHTGKYHPLGAAQHSGIVGEHGLHAYALQRAFHREHVASIVFDDCYTHFVWQSYTKKPQTQNKIDQTAHFFGISSHPRTKRQPLQPALQGTASTTPQHHSSI